MLPKHSTTNTIYNTTQNTSLIGRHNKRGSQVNLPQSTRNSKITDQKYFNRDTSTVPVHFDNTITPGWKRHGNVVTSTMDRMHVLHRANVKYGFGCVLPTRAVDTRVAYFENKSV